VNLAARLERLAGRLERTILASGEFTLAGFAAAQMVFGLSDEAA
jgi:class 3 adenylate cyclase